MIEVHKNLWRGPRPDSLYDLVTAGFKRVINLQSGFEDLVSESEYERDRKRFEELGIQLVDIPCSNIFPPNHDQVIEALMFLRDSDVKTYIHCHSGVDRTGFVIACLRMTYHGWRFEPAHYEFVDSGRHWWFWWWKYALKGWEIR